MLLIQEGEGGLLRQTPTPSIGPVKEQQHVKINTYQQGVYELDLPSLPYLYVPLWEAFGPP